MISVTQFLILALATFRLAEMFVIDDGIFDIFVNLRGWFNRAPMDSKGLRRTIANGLTCVHCAGVWFGFLIAAIFLLRNPITDFIILALAVCGLQSIISCNLGRQQ